MAAVVMVAVGAGFYVRWLLTPEPARLVVWSDWQLTLDDGRALRMLDDNDLRLPAGEYTLFAEPRTQSGQYSATPESIKLRLESGRLYLYQVGGRPITVVARHDGQELRARLVPVGRPLWMKQGELLAEPASAAESNWLPASAKLEQPPSSLALDATTGNCLLVANPFDEPLRVKATLPDIELTFVLSGGSVRSIPVAANKPVSLSVSLCTEATMVEEKTVEPREGLSLYTIGRATCYAWRREGASSDDPPSPLAPEFLLPLATDNRETYELATAYEHPGDYRSTPAGTLLTRTTAAGEREQLYALASAPLYSPKPRPLADPTTHPEVRLKELAAAESLRERPIESISAQEGSLVGLVDGIPHNLSSGEKLSASDVQLVAAAATSRGLVGITRQARLAQIDEGRFTTSANLIDPTLLAWSGPGRSEAYLYSGQAAGGLYAVRDGRWRRVLDATHQLSAVGFIERGLLVAEGRTIERLTLEGGQPKLTRILELPPGPPIIGVHDADGLLVFATDDSVSMYSGSVVLPLVVGIGGPLVPYRGGLLVHDRSSRRLVLVESSLFAAKQMADSGARP